MAISGGNYRVTNDLQQSLSDTLNRGANLGGYTSSNVSTGMFGISIDGSQNSHDIVGITPEMLPQITRAIDDYAKKLTDKLNEMPTSINYTSAFQGTNVPGAVQNFVTSVKDVCNEYIDSLKAAENQIIESVQKQYVASDADIGGQLNSDSSAIRG